MLQNITVPEIENRKWFDTFMRHCLNLMNQNKQLICAIEGKDNLKELLFNEVNINTLINTEIIDLTVNSSIFNQNKIVHIDCKGNLLGINAIWKTDVHTTWTSPEIQNIEIWKQNSLLFSSKIDVLVFKICPKKRTFDIIAQGKIMENLQVAAAVRLIGDFINKNVKVPQKGRDVHETISKESSPKQPFI